MYRGKSFLGIVPARGSSKRLPRKNILPLAGKPLIAWTIEAAKKSKYLDRIIVSTEDKEIAEVSRNYGAEVMIRPEHLATDKSSTVDVILDLLEKIENLYDYIVLLQPTSPLRNEKHIDEAIELLFTKNADAIISVCEAEHSPLWMNTLPEDGNMKDFLNKNIIHKRSQDLPKYYRLNGAIYIIDTKIFLNKKTFFIDNNIYSYQMPKELSIDIDDRFDFFIAECTINFFLKDIIPDNMEKCI